MATACVHSPQQVCVAVTYTDVRGGRGEEMRTDNVTTED